jgi:hypothetical protein
MKSAGFPKKIYKWQIMLNLTKSKFCYRIVLKHLPVNYG